VTLDCREDSRQKPFSRLATVRQPAIALALVLGAAAALGLVSCGGGEGAKLLPGVTAQEISENLDSVKQFASEGECVGAENAAQEVSAQVEGLGGVDEKLKQALQRGAEKLDEVVVDCEETEAVAPADEAASNEEEELPPGLEKKAEKEREKEEKELEKEEEKHEKEQEKEVPPATPPNPTETTPVEPTPPTEGGGTGAPGGVGPAAPVEKAQ
jgi:hypothetical protein